MVALSGCTLDNQALPSLAGPSELGLSLAISASPDIITQDGQSQASIEVIARDASSQPIRGLTLRADIAANGTVVDFGALSSKTVSTDNSGRATLTYYSPGPPLPSVTGDTIISIGITPVNGNYANAVTRDVQIRLTRPGVILPPNGAPKPRFFFSPTQPKQFEEVLFDGSATTDDGQIVSYTWFFGDGSTRTRADSRTSHSYGFPGTYAVVLTVTDDRGFTSSTEPQTITVGTTAVPSADFTFSPVAPEVFQTVFFSAETSVPAPGRKIVSYAWNFGDGNTGSGETTTASYGSPATYTVTLVVTDDQGGKSATTKTIAICKAGGCGAAE